jgi:DNA helicase-2/ATP-dependent DNA helicase PcrA
MLNDEQMKVVNSKDPFIFLLAGAGSGKTRVIVEKIKSLISEGVSPHQILAITFTRKSSHEMKERIAHPDVFVHTFHQLAFKFLKETCKLRFEIVDDHHLQHFTREEVLAIANYKNKLYQTRKPLAFQKYQTFLKQHNMLDYDDLLLLCHRHLIKHPDMLSFQYIFVDEFQDTNLLQYTLLKQLIKKDTHLLAVGDPDQSIYQFRGATPEIIDLFVKEYHAVVYQLTYNYRSDQSIIHTANRLIERNRRTYKKKLNPMKSQTGSVYSMSFLNDESEADGIIQLIQSWTSKGIKINQVAILYRNHYRAYAVLTKLHEVSIPFCIHHDHLDDTEGVHLLTLHQAKGLEFDVVFVIGCEQHVLPSTKNNLRQSIEEERRLMFVGMTRARHFLVLTHINYDAENHHFTSSIFLGESGVKTISHMRISDIISLGDDDGHQKTHGRVDSSDQSSKH